MVKPFVDCHRHGHGHRYLQKPSNLMRGKGIRGPRVPCRSVVAVEEEAVAYQCPALPYERHEGRIELPPEAEALQPKAQSPKGALTITCTHSTVTITSTHSVTHSQYPQHPSPLASTTVPLREEGGGRREEGRTKGKRRWSPKTMDTSLEGVRHDIDRPQIPQPRRPL